MISATTTLKPCTAAYPCGPVRLKLTYDDPFLQQALHGLLNQYDAPWSAPAASIHVSVENQTPPPQAAEP